MNEQVNIYGIFLPTLLLVALAALLAFFGLRRLLVAVGFYRMVWHRPLFDLAAYLCLVGLGAYLVNEVQL